MFSLFNHVQAAQSGMMSELQAQLAGLHASAHVQRERREAAASGAHSLSRPHSIAQRASMSVWGRYMAADRCNVDCSVGLTCHQWSIRHMHSIPWWWKRSETVQG